MKLGTLTKRSTTVIRESKANTPEEWFKSHYVDAVYNDTTKRFDINESCTIALSNEQAIPYPIGNVKGDFALIGSAITSLENMPVAIADSLLLMCPRLKSFVGCTQQIGGDVILEGMGINTFDGITSRIPGTLKLKNTHARTPAGWSTLHRAVKSVHHIVLDRSEVDAHLLGILMIPNLQTLNLSHMAPDKLSELVNTYLSQPPEQRDIFEFQEQLIENGFPEQAQL